MKFERRQRRLGAGPARPRDTDPGFTLMELLVVIGIIGIMAAITAPALKGLMHSNLMVAAHRQLMDDLGLARQMAISRRTPVYMVFVPRLPSEVVGSIIGDKTLFGQLREQQRQTITNLIPGQYTAYALLAKHTVGDQPGRLNWNYLTEWRFLPEGYFINTNQFSTNVSTVYTNTYGQREVITPFYFARFRFPTAHSSNQFLLPYIAFDSQGQVYRDPASVGAPDKLFLKDETIWLQRGSIFYNKQLVPAKGKGGEMVVYNLALPPDVVVTPPGNGNIIRVNWLTGRAQVEQPALK